MSAPYLVDLTLRLAGAVGKLPVEFRNRTTEYLRSAQRSDGGFAGREGPSDLYYTSFALRSLAILGELDRSIGDRAAAFLQSRLDGQEPLVDLLSLVFSAKLLEGATGIDVFADRDGAWSDRLADELEHLRRDDGGYSRSGDGAVSSTYHSFLVAICLQLLGRPVPNPAALARFALSQRRDDGGFVELRAMRTSGTNPTAAAMGLLRIQRSHHAPRAGAIGFLVARQTPEGGFTANTRIAFGDLLSTFTAVLTLSDIGGLDQIDRPCAMAFVDSLVQPEGSFRAAAWDDGTDVEYTFYGLGALALLNSMTDRGANGDHPGDGLK